MERCDVIVVGGGPAGSTCAGRLRDAGHDVVIVDKKAFPRDKTCAGWVTPQVLDLVAFDADEYRQGRTLQPITGFRTGVIGGEAVETDYGKPVSFGIRRCEFDHYLLQKSKVTCRLGEPVRTLDRRDGAWVINESLSAPLLIGAGGHFCPVARMLGTRDDPHASVVAAQEIEFEATPEQLAHVQVEAQVPELYFCGDLQGYGWCFRKGNFLNIGLGRVDNSRVSEHVAGFRDFLRESGRVACDVPQKFHGHAYQLYEHVHPRLVDEGVLLIGDAAGLAYAQSGEGIRPAIESGLMAADVIARSKGNYSLDRLDEYRAAVVNRLGIPRSGSASAWLPAGWLHFVGSKLMATHWFSRHVVLDRWFLHSTQPALAH